MTVDEMAALHSRCFAAPRPWSAAEFAAVMSNPLCFALIESDGFLIGRSVADEAEILTLGVEPDARRRGTGTRLVQGFLAHAQKQGVATAFLEVAESNLPAILLYRQAGFAEIGLRRGYYTQPTGAGLNAVVMSRAV